MNIAASSDQSLQGVTKPSGTPSGQPPVIKGGVTGAAARTSISSAAEMLSKLNELKSSDPEKFQTTLKDMADHLRSDAKAKGGEAGQVLNGLADKVDQAAKTGDLSPLASPSGPPGTAVIGGGPAAKGPPAGGRPSGGSGTSAAPGGGSIKAATDPADSNGDGTVSATEKAVYAITHPTTSETISDGPAEPSIASGALK